MIGTKNIAASIMLTEITLTSFVLNVPIAIKRTIAHPKQDTRLISKYF
jgi:hypothetical protein